MLQARTTYDVYCEAGGCRETLDDLDDTVLQPIEVGWAVWSDLDGCEHHLCPKHATPCSHEKTHMVTETVGVGVYRHLVRHETCDSCGYVVAIW